MYRSILLLAVTLTVSLPAACTTFSIGIWLRAVPAATAEPEVLRNFRRLEALSDFLLIKNAIVLGYWQVD